MQQIKVVWECKKGQGQRGKKQGDIKKRSCKEKKERQSEVRRESKQIARGRAGRPEGRRDDDTRRIPDIWRAGPALRLASHETQLPRQT